MYRIEVPLLGFAPQFFILNQKSLGNQSIPPSSPPGPLPGGGLDSPSAMLR